MATTFYSTAVDNFRCRCDYNAIHTDTTTTISGTIYLQHKGAADADILLGNKAGVGWSWSSNQTSWFTDIETDEISSVAKHTTWTNVKSKTFSYTLDKGHSNQTAYLFVGTGLLSEEGLVGKAITVPVKTTYIITYNANGGEATISSDTKYHDETYYIFDGASPTRMGYRFKCWNTIASGGGTNYTPAQSYTDNKSLTLYAQWYGVPTISSLTAIRCNAQGQEDTNGNCARVTCVWSISGDSATLTGRIIPQEGSAKTFTFSGSSSGSGGTATAIISSSNGQAINTDMQYIIEVTARNNNYSSAYTQVNEILTRAFFTMDFKAGGQAIGIGRAAPSDGLEIGYVASFDDDIKILDRALISLSNYQSTGSTDRKLFVAITDRFWSSAIIDE